MYRFVLHHILSRPDTEWTGETGYIRGELLQRLLPSKSDETQTLACVCGPAPFSKLSVRYVTNLLNFIYLKFFF
jgi:NAD(P)H-flavin reductase